MEGPEVKQDMPAAPAEPRARATRPDGGGGSTLRPRAFRLSPTRFTWSDGIFSVLAALLTVAISSIPQLSNKNFYYTGDSVESFVPLWHHLGSSVKEGQWTPMDPDGWMGGNYAGEAAYGIWNPLNILNFVMASGVDSLEVAGFIITAQFMALLAFGTYLLSRSYGASWAPSLMVAVALPFSGFTLFYEAAGWPAGLMALTWVANFWWSARKFSLGELNPLVPAAFGFLCMTAGNPYGAIGIVVVLIGLGIELIVRARWMRLLKMVLFGMVVGTTAIFVYFPTSAATEVAFSWRNNDEILNTGFLVPSMGDLFTLSNPVYLPQMVNFSGAFERFPTTYLAWFILPLLPWMRWRGALNRVEYTSLYVVGLIYLVFTYSVSNLALLRWPLRLIEYFHLALLVVFALVLSRGIDRTNARGKALATGLIVAFGAYRGWVNHPVDGDWTPIIMGAVLALLAAVMLLAHRYAGFGGLAASALAGIVVAVSVQVGHYGITVPRGPGAFPSDVEEIRRSSAAFEGTVLQLADQSKEPRTVVNDSEIMFGNEWAPAEVEGLLNRYTGIGNQKFSESYCLTYSGSAPCGDAVDKVFGLVSDQSPVNLLDAARVSTLVVGAKSFPDAAASDAPEGWRVQERTNARTVFVREGPIPLPGRLSWVSEGVEVLGGEATKLEETTRVRVPEQGGRLMYARINWPGYAARVDGKEVEFAQNRADLVEIEVPPGEHSVELTYEVPFLQEGLAASAAAHGALVAATLGGALWNRARPGRRKTT